MRSRCRRHRADGRNPPRQRARLAPHASSIRMREMRDLVSRCSRPSPGISCVTLLQRRLRSPCGSGDLLRAPAPQALGARARAPPAHRRAGAGGAGRPARHRLPLGSRAPLPRASSACRCTSRLRQHTTLPRPCRPEGQATVARNEKARWWVWRIRRMPRSAAAMTSSSVSPARLASSTPLRLDHSGSTGLRSGRSRAAAPPPARAAGGAARRASACCGGRAARPTPRSPSARRGSGAALRARRPSYLRLAPPLRASRTGISGCRTAPARIGQIRRIASTGVPVGFVVAHIAILTGRFVSPSATPTVINT
jgi:hypothetical protein